MEAASRAGLDEDDRRDSRITGADGIARSLQPPSVEFVGVAEVAFLGRHEADPLGHDALGHCVDMAENERRSPTRAESEGGPCGAENSINTAEATETAPSTAITAVRKLSLAPKASFCGYIIRASGR